MLNCIIKIVVIRLGIEVFWFFEILLFFGNNEKFLLEVIDLFLSGM